MLANQIATHPDEEGANAAKEAFLSEYLKTPNVYKVSQKLGIRRETIYDWRKQDSAFQAQMDGIIDEFVEGAQQNILEQAVHNTKSFVPAIVVLKAFRPERYDRQAVIDVNVRVIGTSEELKELASKSIGEAQYEVVEDVKSTDMPKARRIKGEVLPNTGETLSTGDSL